ncbi:MAG: chemoreceptor glutamine deamidase CheD [Pseudomonadota bacterium]
MSLLSSQKITAPTNGFDHIHRFWDGSFNKTMAKVQPGECYVSWGQDLITTVLGSCVSVCVRSLNHSVGGMNHIMLPEVGGSESVIAEPYRYGAYAMEHLLNSLFRCGLTRKELEIKVVGGGAVMSSSVNVGARNISFVKQYLEQESFNVTATDVGGNNARRVVYDVVDGRMLVKHLPIEETADLTANESQHADRLSKEQSATGEVELF